MYVGAQSALNIKAMIVLDQVELASVFPIRRVAPRQPASQDYPSMVVTESKEKLN
jgi:hypothetical protein